MNATTTTSLSISKELLREIAGVSADTALSVYMPVRTPSSKNPKTQENMIQLKSLERQASTAISENGVDSETVDTLLRPLREAVEHDRPLWHPAAQGFAFFASPGYSRAVTLPIEPHEHVRVGSSFYVKPLVSALSQLGQFYLLALDQQDVRLLYGDSVSMKPIAGREELPNMPDILASYDFERNLNAAPGARQDVRFGGDTNLKSRLNEFLERLDDAVVMRIGRDSLPVVPVGVEYIIGHYRKLTKLRSLTREEVRGSPSSISEEDMRNAAWEIVKREQQAQLQEAIHWLDKVPANYRLSGVRRVLPAAYEGTLKALYVNTTREIPGDFDPESEQVTTAGESDAANAEDLLNTAVVFTLEAGGEVIDVSYTDLTDMAETDPVVGLHR